MTKRKKGIVQVIVIIVIIVFANYVHSNYIIKIEKKNLNSRKYGIIDDALYSKRKDVIYLNSVYDEQESFSHGEELCDFIRDNYKNYSIFYYNAEINGEINSKGILNGLDKLESMGVKRINISLSSKIYSDDIQNWVTNHADIAVYASYNNKMNSYDYPVMYDGVIASGVSGEVVDFKKNDVKYKTKKIISAFSLKLYSGNSYLSLISMLEDKH
jgi:hypothetical protein